MKTSQEDSRFCIEENGKLNEKTIKLTGVIDEFADLSFFSRLTGRNEINLSGVRRINSFGVRIWMDAVRKVAEDVELTFVDISPPLVEQLNMIQGFMGKGVIESFQVPLICTECEYEESVTCPTAGFTKEKSIYGRKCPECMHPMELDDLEEQYLGFIRTI